MGGVFHLNMKYFEIAMSFIYLAAGVLLLIAPPQSANFSTKFTLPLGIVLVIYGLVRGYRVYKKYYTNPYESENNP